MKYENVYYITFPEDCAVVIAVDGGVVGICNIVMGTGDVCDIFNKQQRSISIRSSTDQLSSSFKHYTHIVPTGTAESPLQFHAVREYDKRALATGTVNCDRNLCSIVEQIRRLPMYIFTLRIL